MSRITVKPGRARINAKIWTEDMSAELTGCHVSKACGMAVYLACTAGVVPGATLAALLREAREHVVCSAAPVRPDMLEEIDAALAAQLEGKA